MVFQVKIKVLSIAVKTNKYLTKDFLIKMNI